MANSYIQRRGDKWVVLNKAGQVISRHTTKEKAESSFRAMEASKHVRDRKGK